MPPLNKDKITGVSILLVVFALWFAVGMFLCMGCNVRMTAQLETSDAVYGKTEIKKSENYYPPAEPSPSPLVPSLPSSSATGMYGVTR